MKITKTSSMVNTYKSYVNNANIGCNVCPCCGETREVQLENNKLVGIDDGISCTEAKGFLNIKVYHTTCYKCHTCGAQWESEPYLSEDDYNAEKKKKRRWF